MLPRIYPVASESGGGADGGAVSPTPTSIPPPPEPKSYIDTWISSPSYAKPNAYSYWGPRVVVKPATIEGEMNEPGSRRVYKSHTVLYDIENPENGTWKLEMIPKDLLHFSYNIDVNPIKSPVKF